MNELEKKVFLITKEELGGIAKAAAETGAKVAIEQYRKEKVLAKESHKGKKLRNTRLLLRNYRMLKSSAENSVFGRSQMEESAADILDSMMNLYNDEIIIESIKRSASRTAIIIAHIEKMLEIYEAYCMKSNDVLDKRRYEIFYKMYIDSDGQVVGKLAEEYSVTKDTIYNDLKVACELLSSLIFGVDGLSFC